MQSVSWIAQMKAANRGWTRLRLVMLFFISVIGAFGTFAASFTATLDRQTIAMGESAMLTLQFEGGEPKAIPSIPAIPNLQIAGRGTSHSMSIINGQVSSTRSENFEVAAIQ